MPRLAVGYAVFLQRSNVSFSNQQAQDKQFGAIINCDPPYFWRTWLVEAVDKKRRPNCLRHLLGQIQDAEVEREPKGDVRTGSVLKCDGCAKKGIVTW